MKKIILSAIFMLTLFQSSNAQGIDRYALGEKINYFVNSLGAMNGYSLKVIIDTFKTQKYNEIEMTYAIYSWVAQNIEFDSKSFHHPNQANVTASSALITRMATSYGYANLFQAMCNLAHIQCVTIEGFAKSNPKAIKNLKSKYKAAWNGVNIDNTWYYVDACWGAGTTDKKMRNFKKEYTDAWFFTNRNLFLLSHYPNNKKWQFTDEHINKSYFSNAPTVASTAVIYDIYPSEKMKGTIRGKAKDCSRIVFDVTRPDIIHKVDLFIKEEMKPAEYYIKGNELYIDVPFPRHGKYPVAVYINNKLAYSFKAEVKKQSR